MLPLASQPDFEALPANIYKHDTDHWKAYEACLHIEPLSNWGVSHADLTHDRPDPIMNQSNLTPKLTARVLGHAIIYAATDGGRDALVHDILACEDDLELMAGLAHLYVFGFICAFFRPKGPTPAISVTQSPRLSFQQATEDLEYQLQKVTLTSEDLRDLTLAREGGHCVFTGTLDLAIAKANYNRPGFSLTPGSRVEPTKVAHIISPCLSENIEGTTTSVREKFNWAKTAGAIIERFGGFIAGDLLGAESLSSPLNAFTSTPGPHEAFGTLDLWLTPSKNAQSDGIPNTYDTNYYPAHLFPFTSIHPRVTFQTMEVGHRKIEAPHPRLIALHATCAQIAHMSGAAHYLQEIFRDTDSISTMTEPTAVDELTRALQKAQHQPRVIPGFP